MFSFHKCFSPVRHFGSHFNRISPFSSLRNTKSPLRRAVLYVPGNDEKKITKATKLDVDCVVLDCEDGVAANRKDEARNLIRLVLDDDVKVGRTDRAVRVNSVESGLAENDLDVILKTTNLPNSIFIPKVESVDQIDWIVDKLESCLKGQNVNGKINLVIYMESAKSLLSLQSICQRASEKCQEVPFALDGIVFGSDDFCANIGASRTREATEILFARQYVIVVAKAFGLQVIDMVHIDYKDLEALQKNSEEGYRMGFTGKQIIHPGQIPIVQRAFSPSEERLQWATELTKAFDEHQKSGKGAFSFRGQMIDMPTVLQAKNIIQHSLQSNRKS